MNEKTRIDSFTANQVAWRAAFVIDRIGNFVDNEGGSRGLSNATDLEVLKSLRRQCDVIITTGKTARVENYKASKVAPIAFISRNPPSLAEIAAFAEPGRFPNLVIGESDAKDLPRIFKLKGFQRPLFEVGPSTLPMVLGQVKRMQIFISLPPDAEAVSAITAFLRKANLKPSNFETVSELNLPSLRVIRGNLTSAP